MDSERCHLYPLQEFCVDGRYLLPSAIALSSDLTPSSELLHLLGLIIVHCTFNMHNFVYNWFFSLIKMLLVQILSLSSQILHTGLFYLVFGSKISKWSINSEWSISTLQYEFRNPSHFWLWWTDHGESLQMALLWLNRLVQSPANHAVGVSENAWPHMLNFMLYTSLPDIGS